MLDVLQREESFHFYVNLDIKKGELVMNKKTGKKVNKMIVEGCTSTSDKDVDGEILVPNGFEFDYFLRQGFINWGHKTDPEHYIGEPLKAWVKDNKFYVRAELYPWSELAKEVYKMASNLRKGSNRRLGWSIEGKSIKKDPNNEKIILKTLIVGMAITPMPRNIQTSLNIVKGGLKDIIKDYNIFEFKKESNPLIIDIVKGGISYQIDKDLNFLINKSMTTSSIAPITKESMEGVLTNLSGMFKLKKEEVLKSLILIHKGYQAGMVSNETFTKVKGLIKKSLNSRRNIFEIP